MKKILKKIQNQNGYTLAEVIISILVSIMVIGALTFAMISSLRNAQLAKRQSQATKYAQEGLEKVRSIRDRGGSVVNFSTAAIFTDLWTIDMSASGLCSVAGSRGPCYFKLGANSLVGAAGPNDTEIINSSVGIGVFKRQIQISDQGCGSPPQDCYLTEKQVTSVVTWIDFAGTHESKLTTILRKI
jgi:type II secretory pathway pseudopilin PulG